MEEISTGELILRPFRLGDARDLYDYACDPRVGPQAGWAPHEDVIYSRAVIRAYRRNGVNAIWHVGDGRVIGSVGLHADDHRSDTGTMMLGYALSPAYWGHGYAVQAAREVMKYAFENGAPLLAAYCFSDNNRSKRVLEKCGFTCEGLMRQAYRLYDGTLHDQWCFSITAREYRLSCEG